METMEGRGVKLKAVNYLGISGRLRYVCNFEVSHTPLHITKQLVRYLLFLFRFKGCGSYSW
jgi:hypothetical protein